MGIEVQHGNLSANPFAGAVSARCRIEGVVRAGPASYPTGGFAVDLRASYSSLEAVHPTVEAGTVLPSTIVVTRNAPTAGQFTVRLMRVVSGNSVEVANAVNCSATLFNYLVVGTPRTS